MAKRGWFAAMAVALVFPALLLLQGLLGLLPGGHGSLSNLQAIFGTIGFILTLIYFTLLFFAIPPCAILILLRIRARWAFLLTGLFSGCFFHLALVIGVDWPGRLADAGSMALFRHVADNSGPETLIWPALLGLAFGWVWSLSYFRLPGSNIRDWQNRVHANNPGDLHM